MFVCHLGNSTVLKRKEKPVAFRAEDTVIMAHSDSRLIRMILLIYFPGEPRIIITFSAKPSASNVTSELSTHPPASV